MRHGVKGRKLGRTASHKAALLNALTTSLLKYKRIKTTEKSIRNRKIMNSLSKIYSTKLYLRYLVK